MPEIVDLTPELIQELLNCDKRLVGDPSQKNKSNGKFTQTDYSLESVDQKFRYIVFVSQHTELVEIFSIGLVFTPDSATNIVLVRYNGNHGTHENKLTKEIITGFHIHTISVEAISRGLKGENQASSTDKYSTPNQAIVAFCEDMHIINFKDYFSDKLQRELFI